jgi:hypothetical protein
VEKEERGCLMDKYPHLNHLNKSSEIYNYPCVILEKIHGSNLRFMYDDKSGIVIGSRSHLVYNESNRADQLGNTHFDSVPMLLEQKELWQKIKNKYTGYTFYGEIYGPSVQKGIKYAEERNITIFDIKDHHSNWLPWNEVVFICLEVGLVPVPELYKGKISPEWLSENVDNVSTLGKENGFDGEDNTQEGVIIKPLTPQRDKWGGPLIVKFKAEKWVERASAPKQPSGTSQEEIDLQERARTFAEEVTTLGRITTIVDHVLRDSSNKKLSMKHTGAFLKELVSDVTSEFEMFKKMDKKKKKVYNKALSSIASRKWREYLQEL